MRSATTTVTSVRVWTDELWYTKVSPTANACEWPFRVRIINTRTEKRETRTSDRINIKDIGISSGPGMLVRLLIVCEGSRELKITTQMHTHVSWADRIRHMNGKEGWQLRRLSILLKLAMRGRRWQHESGDSKEIKDGIPCALWE